MLYTVEIQSSKTFDRKAFFTDFVQTPFLRMGLPIILLLSVTQKKLFYGNYEHCTQISAVTPKQIANEILS